jgi:hypothetical protein
VRPRPDLKEFCKQFLDKEKPFKLSKTQKAFMEIIKKNPDKRIIIATRGQLSRMMRL